MPSHVKGASWELGVTTLAVPSLATQCGLGRAGFHKQSLSGDILRQNKWK